MKGAAAPVERVSTELFFRGRPVAKERVAATFLLGSLAIAVVGVLVNSVLTGGTWLAEPSEESAAGQIRTGDPSLYLTMTPYDLVTAGILVLSLALLGGGFLKEMVSARRSVWVGRIFLGLALLLGILDMTGTAETMIYAWVTVAVAVPFILRMYLEEGHRAYVARGAGFVLFGLYWASQAMRLYTAEGGDFVNAAFSLLAVPFFNYFAYHEILSAQGNQRPRSTLWLSGTSFITTGVYFLTHKIQAVSEWLILRVSEQTTALLHAFGQGVLLQGGDPLPSRIFYPVPPELATRMDGWFPVQIILACTAIQSIMIFVGGILALQPPRSGDGVSGSEKSYQRLAASYNKRRLYAFILTVPLIYVLNLFRNVIIIWMSGQQNGVGFTQDRSITRWLCTTVTDCGANLTVWDNYAAFWFSHNVIGKGGSLVALIIIAFIVFQILPEIYDSIIGLLDLKRRRGPLERWFGERLGRRGNGRQPVTHPTTPETPQAAPPRG